MFDYINPPQEEDPYSAYKSNASKTADKKDDKPFFKLMEPPNY